MSIRFRLLTEADVKAVLSMDDLIETMASALQAFSSKRAAQPVRTVIGLSSSDAFFACMPAYVSSAKASAERSRKASAERSRKASAERSVKASAERSMKASAERAALGAKLVTVVGANHAKGLPSHLASIVLLDPDTGALLALLDGRYITEARTAAVSAVSSRLLARQTSQSLAIIGSGVQAQSHLEALSRVHNLRQVRVWSPQKLHRDSFVANCNGSDPRQSAARDVRGQTPDISAVDHAGEAVVGADIIVLVTSSPTPVIESGWVKPGAHVISVGACRPTQREMDPALVARARLFVDSREAALVESGDVVMGIQEGRFASDHIVAELGELVSDGTASASNGTAQAVPYVRSDTDVTIFKSLGMAVEDVTAAALAYERAVEKGIGLELAL
jgi:alanine dehydrogenase